MKTEIKKPLFGKTMQDEVKESRQETGRRLALNRMPKLKRVLKGIGKLGAYKLEPKDVDQICQAMLQWVNETEVLLRNHQKEDEEELFRFN